MYLKGQVATRLEGEEKEKEKEQERKLKQEMVENVYFFFQKTMPAQGERSGVGIWTGKRAKLAMRQMNG